MQPGTWRDCARAPGAIAALPRIAREFQMTRTKIVMRAVWLWGAGLLAQAAWAADPWLTITGDPLQPGQDTVQVNPVAVERSAESRTLDIRVNRAQPRHNWEGVPYRSYTAQVRIRCDERRGEYLSLRMYVQPLWVGPTQETRYDEPRPPLRFKDVQPNPTERIVRAACPTS